MRNIRLACLVASMLAALASTADAKILITVDKSAQQMTVAVDGVPRWQWPVSTGRRGYSTPSGSYTAFRMEKEHFSKEWDDAPMPNSIFFTKKGHAIHGSYETKRLGTAASHGCVRLAPANAAKLYALVAQRGVTSATVVVTGGSPAQPAPTQLAPEPEANQDYPQPGYPQSGFSQPGFGRPLQPFGAPQPYGQPGYNDPYRQNWR